MEPVSTLLARWARRCTPDDIPADVLRTTKWRVLDTIGLSIAGLTTPFGASVTEAVRALGEDATARLWGTGHRVSVTGAAFANGALAQALEFDDTHNESIVHMSSPSVAAAYALADRKDMRGIELLAAVAIGNEISCRVGIAAPGQFHRRGFHPTGLFAPFGVTYLAGRLLGLDERRLANAAGIAGSFAAGLLQCWVDGTQSKFLHPGWAAQSGIVAAMLGRSGTTGPAAVFEGRFGLFAAHLQGDDAALSLDRIASGLGEEWVSRRASFKPFPAAHVIHPYIDAALRLRAQHTIDPARIAAVDCPVASYIVPIVCEPVAEKRRPQSDSHGRVSFQYSLAEALWHGRLGRSAYDRTSLTDPRILALADRVTYTVDPDFPGPERFKGAIRITLDDGSTCETVEEFNRGSPDNPMRDDEMTAKFRENVRGVLAPNAAERLIAAILALDAAPSARHSIDDAVLAK